MKKMNFYFNAATSRSWLLSMMIILLCGVSLLAQQVTNPAPGGVSIAASTPCATDGKLAITVNPGATVYPTKVRVRIQKINYSGERTYDATNFAVLSEQLLSFDGNPAPGGLGTLPYTFQFTGLTPGYYVYQISEFNPLLNTPIGSAVYNPSIVGGAGTTTIGAAPTGTSIGVFVGPNAYANGNSTSPVVTQIPYTSTPVAGANTRFSFNADATCRVTITPAQLATATDDCAVVATTIDLGNAMGTAGTIQSSATSLSLPKGLHRIYYFARDAAGNITQLGPIMVEVKDITRPDFVPYAAAPSVPAIGPTNDVVDATYTATSLACGGTFTASIPCGKFTTFPYPTAIDACDGPLAAASVTLLSGPPDARPAEAGHQLAPGSYTFVFEAVDAAGNKSTCTYNVNIASVGGAFTCVGNINISMTSCPQVLTIDQFLGQKCSVGTLVLELGRGITWTNAGDRFTTNFALQTAAATLNTSDVGTTIQYRIRDLVSGATCWGNVTIEDKSAPIAVCPANIAVACGTDVNNLCVVGQFPGATNAQACASQANAGSGSDCSAYSQVYTDAVATTNACGAKIITRTWRLKDKWGNFSAACTQIITVTPPVYTAAQFRPNDQNISCTTSLADFATGSGPGGILYRPLYSADAFETSSAVSDINGATSCGTYAILKAVMIVDICGGGKSYMRTWEIRQKCTGDFITSFTQLVNVKDIDFPTATITIDNYSLAPDAATTCFTMGGMPMTATTAKRVSAPITAAFLTPAPGAAPAANAAIEVKALANQSICLMGRVRFKLSNVNATNCSSFPGAANIVVTDNRLTLVNGFYQGDFMFASPSEVQSFSVIITDDCGNTITQAVNVSYEDNANPQAQCKTATVQIPDNSESASLSVSAINNGSFDNCALRSVMMRKMGDTGCWSDVVTFTCADACRTDNMVVLRVIDFNGLVSECMVPVTVNLKASITCPTVPTLSAVTCTDPRLVNYSSLFLSDADFISSLGGSSPCITATATSSLGSLAVSCRTSTATKTWTITAAACAGATITGSGTTCTQTLTVNPVLGFRLTPLVNQNLTCAGTITTKEQDQASIIASLKLLHTGAAFTTITQPTAANATCSAPVVDVTESVYTNTDYCKVIVRTYVVKDICMLSTATSSQTAIDEFVPVANGDYQSFIKDGGHYIRYTRTITVQDRTAPTSTAPANLTICDNNTSAAAGDIDTDGDNCEFGFSTPLNATDNCGTTASGSNLNYTWRIVDASGAELPGGSSGTGATVSRRDLPFGVYTVVYRVADLCGNISSEYRFTVTGKDCKLPEILVHDKIVALGGQRGVRSSGMVTLNYSDISNFLRDNCTDFDYLDSKIVMEKGGATSAIRPISTSPNRTLMFDCSELGAQKVRVWTVDKSGNWNFAISTITVQDNEGICVGNLIAQVSGGVRTEGNSVVPNVSVSASVNGANAATGDVSNGAYVLNLAPASNVQVRAAKTNNDDAATGVTTFDIAKVSQHVLDIEKLATPYKLIAADVDKSGEIDATDMLHMRRFILKITPSLPGGNFRFVDKAYGFRNAANPFGEDFPEVVNIASLTTNAVSNFVAVKLGDVNDSYNGTVIRSARTLNFNVNDMNVNAGTEYTVNISADKMDAASFQGTFSFNGATVKSVKAGTLANMTDGNFGIFANAVTTSWNGKTQDAADVMTITFVANKSGKLSDMLTVNSALTQAVANDEKGSEMNVNLKFNTGKVAGGEFALYQNQPNPVAGETTIGFNLPKDGTARLTVTSVDGKVVKVINGDYKAGYNVVTINKSDIQASGVFYYRLETADHSASKKMVIIE